jgi:GAF domain-containing protein
LSAESTSQHKQLLQENQRLASQVTLLQRVLHLFAAPHDFDAVFDGLMDATMEFFAAHAGALYIYDADKDELYFASARGPKAREVLALDITIKPGQGIAGSSFQNNEVIAVSDAHKDPRFSRQVSDAVGYEVRSMLTTPIVCDGQPLGALQVINKKGGSVFSTEEVELARQLGRFAGGLIGLGCEVDELRRAAGVS